MDSESVGYQYVREESGSVSGMGTSYALTLKN
jgi:hypothetical protein